jgi:peptidoglycan/LPS O-acetylase OafA/YrhL
VTAPLRAPTRSAPLDGVRALAVVAVLAYHAHYGWASGGYLGVDVFFVLSGYLITGVLLSTHRSWWGYRRFLVRRAVRLLPALAVAVLGAALVAGLTGLTAPVGRCSAGSLGYVMNLPFAESWDCPAMWHITWSLAAEQQFYVVWPVVLWVLAIGARRVLGRVRPLGRRMGVAARTDARVGSRALGLALTVALGSYALSVLWQVFLRREGEVLTARLAFGPDGRCLVILLGCALALWGAVRRTRRDVAPDDLVDTAVLLAVGTLVVTFSVGEFGRAVSDLWPLLVAATSSVALVWGAAHAGPTSATARVLGAGPVAWLGRVSYSLYLWHEVGYRLAEQVAPRGTVAAEALRFVLAVALAAASYHGIEQPVQRWWSARGRERTDEQKVLVATSS